MLGPLAVSIDDSDLTPTATKQRVLLALLAVHANTFVSTDRIVDTLWDHAPPRSARAALHGYVTAVRRALVPRRAAERPLTRFSGDSVLITQPSGYLLRLAAEELDLLAFREHARLGRAALAAGEHALAEQRFGAALRLWTGTPLADLQQTGVLNAHAARLAEERVQLTHDWADALLGQGKGTQAVCPLEELCTSHPMRERGYHQLMLALCQADRRADALAVYSQAYRVLTTEAGIEPCHRLRETHRELLGERSAPAATAWRSAGGRGEDHDLRRLRRTAGLSPSGRW
ncbi:MULTISPECIES: AfsR/SARP family transcriptional regulator [Actinoalloteichus]|uniref:AfsR/SARP family transcriptional regulator n=1 Tax=Actinoalloteichus TaxID=65496 RepID=UPI000951F160|nr:MULTISPECIES: AfsR/SARP family transcriptional regulator [Actinoalloteichus]